MRCVVTPIGVLLAGALVTGIRVAAIELELSRADIERAVAVGRGPAAQRARFHVAYQIPITDDFVETLEVITEYRRAALITEQRVAAGEWAFGMNARSAEEALRPWKRKVSIRTRIRFHPHNVYTNVPTVDITVGAGRDQLMPLHSTTDPQYALGNHASGFAPLIGALVETDFDAVTVGQRTLEVTVRIQGAAEVHRSVNFESLK